MVRAIPAIPSKNFGCHFLVYGCSLTFNKWCTNIQLKKSERRKKNLAEVHYNQKLLQLVS